MVYALFLRKLHLFKINPYCNVKTYNFFFSQNQSNYISSHKGEEVKIHKHFKRAFLPKPKHKTLSMSIFRFKKANNTLKHKLLHIVIESFFFLSEVKIKEKDVRFQAFFSFFLSYYHKIEIGLI